MEAEGEAAIVVNSGDLCRGCLCFSQVNTGTNTQLLSRSLLEGTLSFFFFSSYFLNLSNCFVYLSISDLEKHGGLCASN